MQTTPDPVVQLISGKTVYWLLYIWWKISWNRWIYRIIFLLCLLVANGCEGRAIHICILQSSYLSFHISSVKRDVQWYSRFCQCHYISIFKYMDHRLSNTLWYSRFCQCAINTGLSIVQNRNIDGKSVYFVPYTNRMCQFGCGVCVSFCCYN